eukprot:GHUV01024973.1.p1 GENE.GHUV01024973.1~~GHUV01024973.1.p1  ORF type:complete len:414 (+),score=146.25 GHUV01024973.1:1024-2265(+)
MPQCLNLHLLQVQGSTRTPLQQGVSYEIYADQPTQQCVWPLMSAVCVAGDVTWHLQRGSHTMRSTSDAGEPTFIFSSVVDRDIDTFYCVIFKRGHSAHDLELLEQILSKISVLHISKNATKNQVPFNLPIPQVDPKTVNEIMRKGAEDTQLLLKQAGDIANRTFLAAAETHKKYAPKPAEQPVAVPPEVKDKVVKAQQATTAGAAVAKGVATGMQAATVEVSTTLVQIVKTATAGKGKDGSTAAAAAGSSNGGVPEPLVVVGGIGMEVMRDIAAVRDAVLAAAGSAWQGARVATVDVMNYQYGGEVAAVTAESCDAVEGVANMAVAMKYAQPTQVLLTSVKDTTSKLESDVKGSRLDPDGEKLKKQLEEERAALAREKAALAAERARLQGQQPQPQQQQQQRKGTFGLLFALA